MSLSKKYKCSKCGKDIRHKCDCNKRHPQYEGNKSGEGIEMIENYYQGYDLEEYYYKMSKKKSIQFI